MRSPPPSLNLKILWLILGLFLLVLTLELATPSDYVFGYLYTGPILLATSRLNRPATLPTTGIAVFLTLLNIWVPIGAPANSATIANRLIACLSLVVTGILSGRNRRYEQAIAQQQAQLQSQEQLVRVQEDFVSTLTHDLKTPLLGAIETLKSFQQENLGSVTQMQQQVLAMLTRSHQTMLRLVETLLDVYRYDLEGLRLEAVALDLAQLVEESVATLTDLAAARRIHLWTSYGESEFRRSLWVQGDAWQLQRVIVNLITNAIKHSPRGSRVEIVLESFSSYQLLKVMDTGLGIPADELPHLFERFYQGHSDRQAKGSGLGLYLSRQIIEAHNGTIWAENRSPQGALFVLRLPACSPPASPL